MSNTNKPGRYFPIIKLMHLGVLSFPQKAYGGQGTKHSQRHFFLFIIF